MARLAQTRFLLDANLSPKIGRFLADHLQLNVRSLLAEGLGDVTDQDVLAIAQSDQRVIITLDRDFEEFFLSSSTNPELGIIYLDLSRSSRNNIQIRRILEKFFSQEAATIDLKRSLVVITERGLTIHRPPSLN